MLYCGSQSTYPCFPGVLLTGIHTIFFPCNWLLFYITIVEIMDSGERGMNPVTMTFINPRKEYWPSWRSNQKPPVLKSITLPTELWILVFPRTCYTSHIKALLIPVSWKKNFEVFFLYLYLHTCDPPVWG